MNDRLETRIRSFLIELLDDPPQAPPFNHTGTVVIRSDRTNGREPMLGTKKSEDTQETPTRGSRRPLVVGAAILAIIVIGAVVAMMSGGDDGAEPLAATSTTVADTTAAPEPEATTTTALSGRALQGAAGVVGLTFNTVDKRGSQPDGVAFNEDGTFEVTDDFRTVDSGVYTTNGDEITFESDATAHDPRTDVRWFYDPILNINNNACEGVVGSYTVTWETSTEFVLNVISDACPRRISSANRLKLGIDEEAG